jgi:hypothetical protein
MGNSTGGTITGTDPGTQPPVVTPTPTDYPTLLASDRAAIKAATLTRRQHLRDLSAIIKADVQAYKSALRQFRIAQHAARKARLSLTQADPIVAALATDAQTLLQTIKNDKLALSTARHTDFSGIIVARQTLSADQKAFRRSRHR